MNHIFLLITFLFLSLKAFAEAVVPPGTVEEAVGWVPQLIEKLVAGDYLIAGGIAIMLLMVVLRQYLLPKWNLSASALPWVTSLIAMLSMVGLSMFNNVPILEALKNGFVMAIISGGTWDMLGKELAKLVLGDKYQETAKK
jgi:hypothetical protein